MATSPKKPSSRKPAAARPSRKASIPLKTPNIALDRQALAQLPAGFAPEGFEIIGDQVRVYGKVRDHVGPGEVGGDPNWKLATPSSGPYPEPPQTVARNSVVFDSLHAIGRRIDEAWNAIEALEQAAASILVPQPPAGETASAGKDPQPVESPAVSLANDLSRGLERLTNRINHITGRVQA